MNKIAKILTFTILMILLVSSVSAFKVGDLNRDGVLTQADNTIIGEIAVSIRPMPELNSEEFCLADINQDEHIDVVDNLKMARILEGSDSPINIECSEAAVIVQPDPVETLETSLRGDLNNDKLITIVDAPFASQWSVGASYSGRAVPSAGSKTFCKADVDGDGRLTAVDSQKIAEKAAGINSFIEGTCDENGVFTADEIIEEGESNFVIEYVEASKASREGQKLEVSARVKNNGNAAGSIGMILETDATSYGATKTFLEAGSETEIEIEVDNIKQGMYPGLRVRFESVNSRENAQIFPTPRYIYSGNPQGWQAGDVNQNGAVEITDAQIVSHMSVASIKAPPREEVEFCLADVNQDGQISVLDANMISKIAAGLESPIVQDCRNPIAIDEVQEEAVEEETVGEQAVEETSAEEEQTEEDLGLLRGDANRDGAITALDALAIAQAIQNQEYPETLEEFCTYDANNDGLIDEQDPQVAARQASGQEVIPDQNCENQSLGLEGEELLELILAILELFGLSGN